MQDSHFLPQSLSFSLQFTISQEKESVRCERAAQDRLIIAFLEIRKVSAVKSCFSNNEIKGKKERGRKGRDGE